MVARSVVLVPDDDATQGERNEWRAECLEACRRQGYDIVGFAATWEDAAYMVLNGEADIVMAAKEEHFPTDRLPRTETPGTPPRPVDERPRQRRARWLNNR